jgi:hypothetical protein
MAPCARERGAAAPPPEIKQEETECRTGKKEEKGEMAIQVVILW